jgi:3-oxoacyl-[acyl-carrier protein] reductase
VHNALAGFAFDPRHRKAVWDLTAEDYAAQVDAAVGAAHTVTRAALPDLTGHGRGRIVSVLSDLLERPGVPYPEYVTAKSALLGWSRAMAAELGPPGVTVNCVAPGLVPSTGAAVGTDDQLRDGLEAATPLRRLAEPEDVAGAVLAFASDWLGFVTGACLFVDGGLVMR